MNETQKDCVILEQNGFVASVILNTPPHNPLSMAVIDRLEEIFTGLAANDSVRTVLFTGAGERSFSVGADIREFGTAAMEGMGFRNFIDQRLRVADRIENLSKPVICAIRGACVGGGLELALACHFRIAATGARIGLPEIELGIVPAWGGTQRLTRTVGRAHALDLILRAKRIGAEEAYRIGLVHEVCAPAELLERARALANELAQKAPIAVAGVLKAVVRGGPLTLNDGLALELEAVEAAAGSEDAREGVLAFLEKRKPVFRGR
ncbi:MAG: enoyl-CoA hydratase-related protein [bacterium]